MRLRKVVYFALILVGSMQVMAGAKILPVPDNQKYSVFLLEDWNPYKPSIVMMLDPFCPYCIRTLEQRDRLEKYNVFLFWSPILGSASEKRVEKILQCERPTSQAVISSVIAHEIPDCIYSPDIERVRTNNELVNIYDPKSVPAYYFGGRRVGLNQLNQYVSSVQKHKGSISIDWERYKKFRISQASNQLGRVGVFLPSSFQGWESFLLHLQSLPQYEWHLFPERESLDGSLFCSEVASCTDMDDREIFRKRKELMLLFDISELAEPRFILNNKLLTPSEAEFLFGFDEFPY